jgi:hypothetical protein
MSSLGVGAAAAARAGEYSSAGGRKMAPVDFDKVVVAAADLAVIVTDESARNLNDDPDFAAGICMTEGCNERGQNLVFGRPHTVRSVPEAGGGLMVTQLESGDYAVFPPVGWTCRLHEKDHVPTSSGSPQASRESPIALDPA